MIHLPRFRAAVAGLALALAPLAALTSASPALAQAGEASDAAYGDLYDAMEGSIDQELMVDKALAVLAREFAASEDFKIAEANSPGLIKEMIDGLRPIFMSQSERVRLLYRPTTLTLLARHLKPDEATSIAAFYRSDLGRRLMGRMVNNYSPDATLANLQSQAPVTAEQVEKDISKATNATISAMTQDDLMELGKLAMAKPELLKLSLIGNGVQELRAQMENEPLTAEEEAAIEGVINDVFSRRFPAE